MTIIITHFSRKGFTMPGNRNFSTSSSLSMTPPTLAYITWLKSHTVGGNPTRECDYSKILALALPEYFTLGNDWCVAPEWTLDENITPDYLVSRIETNSNLPSYGGSYNHLVVEVKDHVAVSWWKLLETQAWSQCDLAKNSASGRIYFVGQIGYEICFFFFDVRRFPSHSDNYTNFFPMNLRSFTTEDLDYLNIKYLTEVTLNNLDIRVIKWRWDDPAQHIYINEMFNYILNNTV